MKYLIYLIAIILLLALDLGLFGQLPINGQVPNLLFLLTLYFVLDKKDNDFLFVAFVCGLFLDFFSVGFFGRFTLAFLLTAFCLRLFSDTVELGQNFQTLASAFMATFTLYSILIFLLEIVVFKFNWSAQAPESKIIFSRFLVNILYNLLLLYPMHFAFNFLRRTVENLSLRKRIIK